MIGDQAVDVYHAQETALVHRATLQLDDPVLAVAFAPHGPLLALATSPTVELWRSEDDAAPGVLDTGAQRMVFAPDGASLVTVWDDVAELWSVTDMMCIATFAAHTDIITSAAFAPDGQTVALASQDGTVHLWKVPHQP
jgi:WD40 repeat protein